MNLSVEEFKEQIIEFNIAFPLDKKYRDKYRIGLFSDEHLKVNPLNVYLEFLEDTVYDEVEDNVKKQMEEEKEFVKGNFFKERQVSKEQSDKMWNKIKANFKNIT